MGRYAIRYVLIMACALFLFGSFIACGAQMYRVSLKNDIDPQIGSQLNTDPASPVYGLHAPGGWVKLPIDYRFGTSLSKDQRTEITACLKTWEWAVGEQLFNFLGIHEGVDGDTFPDLYSSLKDMINGHYFDFNWAKTSKPEKVLATTIWQNSASDGSKIQTSDIRYNTKVYVIGDALKIRSEGEKEVVDLQSLCLHESGHMLGLAHVEESVDRYSVMNPSLYIGEGLTTRKLSKGDFERIQKIYGCHEKACDIEAMIEDQEHNSKGDTASLSSNTTAH